MKKNKKLEIKALTVGDIKKAISDLDDSLIVVLSKDEEGNSYSPLAVFSTDYNYTPIQTWRGFVALKELTEDDIKMGYCEDDLAGEDSVPCLTLWPLN
jgi:hypothetical protein